MSTAISTCSGIENFHYWHVTIRGKCILATAALALATVATMFMWPSSEPCYAGRRLSEWLFYDLRRQTNAPPPGPAEAVRHIGPKAIPFLIRWIADYDRPSITERMLNWTAAHLPSRVRPDNYPHWTGWEKRLAKGNAGILGFKMLGPSAAPAIPELEALAANPGPLQRHLRWISALEAIGPQSIPALERLSAFDHDFGTASARSALQDLRRKSGMTNALTP
jgi:hypothetical protein